MYKLCYVFFVVFFVSCNSVSTKNISNDYRWKNKKFDSKYYLEFDYNPIILNEILSNEPMFLKKSEFEIDSVYKIKDILIKKFNKRNIYLKNKGDKTLSIDSLVFKEYSEPFSVYNEGNNNEYIGESEKDYFFFKIFGHIEYDNKQIEVSSVINHNTFPRESYTISGLIVKDGVNANSFKMIENTINEFSYKVYENLRKL